MSVRTVVEFNHDYAHRIEEDTVGFAALLTHALRSGHERTWECLEYYGARRVVQAHHADDRKVVVNGEEHPIP